MYGKRIGYNEGARLCKVCRERPAMLNESRCENCWAMAQSKAALVARTYRLTNQRAKPR